MSAPVLMVLATLLFATMGVCVKLASAHYSTGEIVLYRGLIGMAAMAGMARRRGERLRTHRLGMHFWRSATGSIALVLWFYAISGVALVLRPTLDPQQLWHGLSGLLSGMLSAMAYLQVTTLGRAGEPATRIVFYFSIGGALIGGVLSLFTGLHAHTLQSAALVLAIGLLATGAQMLTSKCGSATLLDPHGGRPVSAGLGALMTQAYRVGSTLSNASLQYLGIAFSFGYGALLFHDPVTWMAVAGMLLIVAAGLTATLVRSRTAPKDAQESTTEL